jgi:protocatechuate 3,4-dioxygenase beta subunit
MRLAVSLLCLAWLQAVPPPRDGAKTGPKAGTGVITGRVLAGSTDIGVAGAMVYIAMTDLTTPFPRAVITDRNGRFRIDKLATGSYPLQARPPEHTARLLPTDRPTRPLDVAEGATVAAPEIRLPLAAAVSGRVTDENGEPLAEVRVYAMSQRGGSKPQRAGSVESQTDDQGRFRVFGLSAGDIILVADTARGYESLAGAPAFVTTYHPDAVSDTEARRITLLPGADVDGMDIRMTRTRTFRVRGTIVDSKGLPFATASAGLHRQGSGGSSTTSISVSPDGAFEISGLLPGAYRIVVGNLCCVPYVRSQPTEYATVPFEVSDADVDDILVTTKLATDLTVRVVFEPQPPATPPAIFSVIGWSAQELGFTTPQGELQPDSTVVLKGVVGPLILRQTTAGGRYEWFLKGVFLGTRDITDTPTEFAPADATRVRLLLSKTAATVTGTLTDNAGKPAREGAVVLFPEDRAAWIEHSSGILTAMADKNGVYKIQGVRAGRYRIAAVDRAGLGRAYEDRAGLFESLVKDAVAIVVTENEQRVVDLKFAAAGGA